MSNSLDTDAISKLAEILDKRNLTELEYEDEGCRICLTRELPQQIPSAQLQSLPITATYAQAQAAPQVVAPKEAAPAASLSEEDYAKLPGAVKSPMVGVVYLSSDPNSPDYVKVGDSVNVGDTVCLIEAMKTFNPVKAHISGKVTKILVSGGDPVEYGEPLIIIE